MDFIRHTDKVSNKLTPEDVSDDEIKNMREKVLAVNPDLKEVDDESLRHLVLFEKDSAVFGPEIDGKTEKSSITFAGILRTQQEAKNFTDNIDNLPENAVIILGKGSPKDRCQETEWIYGQEIKTKANNNENLKIFENEGLISEEDLDKQNIGKAVMINNEDIEGIDSKKVGPWGPEYLGDMKKWVKKEVEDKETPAVKVWVALKSEVENLKEEFVEQGIIDESNSAEIDPALFKIKENTPEIVAKDVIKYFKQVLESSQEKYPNRPVHFLSASHNMILDVASLRLLGHKISRENLNKLALDDNEDYEASLPLESRRIRFEGGKLIFSFRGKEKELSLEELEDLTKDGGILDQEAEERFKEWQS